MEYPERHEWELASDAAERNPLADLPENPVAGTVWQGEGTDGVRRSWIAVRVVAGNYAGIWAYWLPWKTVKGQAGIGPHPEFRAVADKIFNGDGHNFIGMLASPFIGPRSDSVIWVLTDPKPVAPPIEYVREAPIPSRNERYERSKEVYDVETGESRDVRDIRKENEVPSSER